MLVTLLSDAIDYGIVGILLVLSIVVVATALEGYAFCRNLNFTDFASSKSLELP